MVDFVTLALIGLALLLPLVILFVIILAAANRPKEQAIPIPEVKPQERYGWEDYLKLPEVKRPKSRKKLGKAVVLAAFALLLLAPIPVLLSYIDVGFGMNQVAVINETVNATAAVATTPEFNATYFSNLTVNHSVSLPSINFSGFVEGTATSLTPYIAAVTIAFIVLLLGLGIFVFLVRKKRFAVINRAKDTAEKLIQKAEEKATGKKKSKHPLRQYLAPLIILALLVIIATLIYFLRDMIRSDFSAFLIGLFDIAREFLLEYRLFITLGAVIVAVIIGFIKLLKK